ncbi:MAG: glycoside hydrolase family 57 protein [Proteobacteria bacterium]|nr:glycoside hydrolase family 57 protein [Pseudomonadota bacterium]
MVSVCMYFQVHQPNRLRRYSFFDIGRDHFYEDDDKNCGILRKVANKCYLPTNQVMLDLIKRHGGRFRIAYSLSGTAVDQLRKFSPETLDSFKRLVDTGCVEILSETYNHSLAFLYSKAEFHRQVDLHREMVRREFGVTPTAFRNTELIYNNDIAAEVERMGYKVILAEGADRVLGWRSPNFVYQPDPCAKLRLLLKNYRLSDDVAFRFSNRGWPEWPLTAEKYASWVHQVNGNGETVNLFMDYETFGEHQWADTGIFEFLSAMPAAILAHPDFTFHTPSEVAEGSSPMAKLDVRDFVSWADVERDLTAWRGNPMQEDALEAIYGLEKRVLEKGDPDLARVWRSLQTSDHFYYMCTKWFADGDVHKYFNPYPSPYDAYINFQNVLGDFETTLAG